MTLYRVEMLCYQSARHPECTGHHIVAVLANYEPGHIAEIIYPKHVPNGGAGVLSRWVAGRSPRHAASRFRQWQKRGLSEEFLTRGAEGTVTHDAVPDRH